MENKHHAYLEHLETLRESGRLRTIRPITRREGKYVYRDDQKLLNLSSNDYLGLASDPALLDQFYKNLTPDNMIDRYGLGSSASRLMTGSTALCASLEKLIGKRYACAALLFNSGYHANMGILPALAGPRDVILADKLVHASIIDGLRLSKAKFLRYRHLDFDHCAQLLEREREKYERVFIVTESIFSMDGDIADLPRLVALKRKYDACLYVDEAHAVGVRGKTGLGICEEQDVIAEIDIIIGTFGKALASLGAYAALAAPLRDMLINTMRPFIFTTALPPVVIHWNLHIFNILPEMNSQRRALAELAAWFRTALRDLGIPTPSESQIIPVIVGGDQQVVALAEKLIHNGFLALAVRPPTVPPDTARIRFSLCTNMMQTDLTPLTSILI